MAAAAVMSTARLPFISTAQAAPDDPIRIGLIGCGGRGTGATADALGAATKSLYPEKSYHAENVAEGATVANKSIQVMAMADLCEDRLQLSRAELKKLGMQVPNEACFVGFDAYQKLLAIPEINYVILATPPPFRSIHLKAAVEAGKHVFAEKPVAVDGPGVRMVIAAAELAKQKGLGILAGTHRRHSAGYQETIQRIHDGALGDVLECRSYFNVGVSRVIDRQPGWSDMEYQIRNWLYYTWTSGDHIVDAAVHGLDVINWAMNSHPIQASGIGGRQAPGNDPRRGNIFDHFAIEFEYPNGVSCFSQCRQMSGCDARMEEMFLGPKGVASLTLRGVVSVAGSIKSRDGSTWRCRAQETNPYQQEHLDFIASIRAGQPLNEARQVAESTLMGIMGREAAYSGRAVTWEQALNSQKQWTPDKLEFGPLPVPPTPVPGVYKFV
jgi:myo-inositol 2-dehydrogenase/D-chiro-inositol 1-dehydrogenase